MQSRIKSFLYAMLLFYGVQDYNHVLVVDIKTGGLRIRTENLTGNVIKLK